MTVPNEQDRSSERWPADPEGPREEAVETAEDEIAALQAAVAAAEARAAEHKDLYMRALAEIENVRKRAARDVEQAHKFGLDRLANDLIGVKDSLELGLANSPTNGDASSDVLRAGTEATLKLLSRAFEKAGLTEIVPTGEVFNPQLHEAMALQPSAEAAPDTVLQVVQKGYQLNGRLLRPARVLVARAP